NAIKNYFNKKENKFEISRIFRKIDYQEIENEKFENGKFENGEFENEKFENGEFENKKIEIEKIENGEIENEKIENDFKEHKGDIDAKNKDDNYVREDKNENKEGYNDGNKIKERQTIYISTISSKRLSFKLLTYNLKGISRHEVISILLPRNTCFLERYFVHLYLNSDLYCPIFYLIASYAIDLIPLFPEIDYEFVFFILFRDKLRYKECYCLNTKDKKDVVEDDNDNYAGKNSNIINSNDKNNDKKEGNDIYDNNKSSDIKISDKKGGNDIYHNNKISDKKDDNDINSRGINNVINNNDINNVINNNDINNEKTNFIGNKPKCIFCRTQLSFEKSKHKINLYSDENILKRETDLPLVVEVARKLIQRRRNKEFLSLLMSVEKKIAILIFKNLPEALRAFRTNTERGFWRLNKKMGDENVFDESVNICRGNEKLSTGNSIPLDNFDFSYLDCFGFEFWEYLEIDTSVDYLVFLFMKAGKKNFYSLVKVLKNRESAEVVEFFTKCHSVVEHFECSPENNINVLNDDFHNNNDLFNTGLNRNPNENNDDQLNGNDTKDTPLDKKLQEIILLFLKQGSPDELVKNYVTGVFMDDSDYFYQVMVFLDKKSLLKYIPRYLTDEGLPYFLKKFEPSELFFECHFLELEGVHAIKICIANFDEEIVVRVLILLEDKLPALFMRSVILAYLRFKNRAYTVSLLKRLVARKIWGMRLYAGFLKCLEVVDSADCADVLREMPVDICREMVLGNEKIKNKVISFLRNNRDRLLEGVLNGRVTGF
ncbi:hypothetical protein EQH57_0545, partial [Dictyocoela roeselum]